MTTPIVRSSMLSCFAVFAIGGLANPAWAGDRKTPGGDENDTVSRLESLLDAQQRRIEQLENRVLLAERKGDDAARVDQMRQQIREILNEKEFRESLMPSTLQAGYDSGFYLRSSDDKFLMKINGLLQFRWTHYATRSSNRYLLPNTQRNDRTGFDVQRFRLLFGGHAYDKDLTYLFELKVDAADQSRARAQTLWFDYRFSDEFHVRMGMFRIASTRMQGVSDTAQHMADRSPEDAVFGLDRAIGVRFWGQLLEKRVDYFFDVVNSFNSETNRTITTDPPEMDSNPGLAFRTVWHALAEKPGEDFKEMSDLQFHQSPALDFGFHYAFNEDEGDAATTRLVYNRPRTFLPGGFGLSTSNGTQINQFGLDTAFKWQGFSLVGEYVLRLVDIRRADRTPFTPLYLLSGEDSTTAQHGAYVSVGYFLPIPGLEKKLEAVARVGGISTNVGGGEGTWEYAAGLNYYIQGSKVKLQTDVTKISEVPISSSTASLANVNDDALIFRVQLQVGF